MITLGCLACSVFLYSGALGRIIEGGRDFGLSIGYYFCEMFGIEHNITPTVNDLPKIPFFDFMQSSTPSTPLPDTTDGFKASWTSYWQLWITKANFMGYLSFLGDGLYTLCRVLVIILPLVFGLYCYLKRYFKVVNNDYNKDSRPLKVCKWLTAHTYAPIKRFVVGLWTFIKEHKSYIYTWGFIWAFNFNIIAIVIEFLAYYFYFVVSFDVVSIYRQIYKLFLDLSVPFKAIPVWTWAMIGLVWFDNFRKRIAYATLNHYEMRNRGFVNARPIVFMTCGTMGKKKTTTITDMALSQEVMFRDKALEKLLENDLKFPYFPWINLENELKRAMQYHEVYNLATVRKFVYKKAKRWQKTKTQSKLFDYEYERYGFTYDDKLKIVNVWEVIENYAQLYFIYIIQSSLIISNYSIRVDAVLSDLGNFPVWNSDFFKRDSRLIDSFSRHSHILDFDSLRLGRKVVKNNINANNFEFGVVVITEVGKERGNNLELQEKKKKDIDANQKNDLFNSWLKMVRHSATVDNFPFVRVIVDEQRPESWGADARDLCEIVHIRESGDTRLAMPFFSLAELLYDWILGKFLGLYYQYRYVRSDKTVPMYALKAFTAKIDHYYTRIYNRFGYCRLQVQTESGTQDGQRDENKYYLIPKKIYSKRFSTDCYSEYFTEKALRSPVGIDDLREYETEKATFSELRLQNSYFVNDLLNGLTDNKK